MVSVLFVSGWRPRVGGPGVQGEVRWVMDVMDVSVVFVHPVLPRGRRLAPVRGLPSPEAAPVALGPPGPGAVRDHAGASPAVAAVRAAVTGPRVKRSNSGAMLFMRCSKIPIPLLPLVVQ